MKYLVVVHKDQDTGYGVSFPDVPGCFSYGDSYEDALDNAREALAMHFELLAEEGKSIPVTKDFDSHVTKQEYQGALFATVELDPYDYMGKAKRVNISIPGYALKQIDEFVAKQTEHHDRSRFLLDAALHEIEKSQHHQSH